MLIKHLCHFLCRLVPVLLLLFVPVCGVMAQDMAGTATVTPVAKRSWLLNLEVLAGTSGLGLGMTERLAPHWELHAGGAWLPFSFAFSSTLSDIKVRNSFDNALGQVHLLAAYNPFSTDKGFRLRVGMAYFLSARATLSLNTEEAYKYGDIQLTPAEMGTMTVRLKRGGLATYAGLQCFKLYTRNRFSVTADLGVYYLWKDVDVQVEGSGYLKDNQKNEAVLQRNLAGYRWLPQVQLAFHYRLGQLPGAPE